MNPHYEVTVVHDLGTRLKVRRYVVDRLSLERYSKPLGFDGEKVTITTRPLYCPSH